MDKIYAEMIQFFKDECDMDERNARKCAGNAENILLNAQRYDWDFVWLVCRAIRNGVFVGQEIS